MNAKRKNKEKIGKIKKKWKQQTGRKPHRKFFFSAVLTNKLRMKTCSWAE